MDITVETEGHTLEGVTVEYGNLMAEFEMTLEFDSSRVILRISYATASRIYDELRPYFTGAPDDTGLRRVGGAE